MFQGQNIQVFVRCRPLDPNEKRSVVEVSPEKHEIKILDRNVTSSCETRNFYFDQVFAPDAHQYDVYKTVVRPLIDQVLLGFNCTVFAYGQTGTGKTYTMEGDRSDEDLSWEEDPHSGIIPRAISQLFNTLKDQDNEFTVRVSFLELYNEDTYDLLSPIDDTTKLKIFDDAHRKGSVIIGGLEEIVVQSKDEIYDILKRGSAKRQTAATLLNACSSRSHTIFNITVHIKESSIEGTELLKIGKLNLVDLAGSESIGRTGAQDKRARETGNINQSLLTLGRVITALVEKGPHVPYRESKLTRILQDSLGGTTRTSIIATISPSDNDITNTISTLDYASRARYIVNRPESNQQLTQKRTLVEFNREIQILMDKHSVEMSELEFKVRNEVAVEFKREMEKMKQSYKEQYESNLREIIEQRDKLAKQLQESNFKNEQHEASVREIIQQCERLKDELKDNMKNLEEQRMAFEEQKVTIETQKTALEEQKEELETQITGLKRDIKVSNQKAEYREELLIEIENKLKSSELELRNYKEENKQLRAKLSENTETEVKKASRIRKAPVLEECGEYANMTFDAGDELLQVSTKKSRKKVVAGTRKRAINESIMLSGKKRKLKHTDAEAELSPIQIETRVTRSRATRTNTRRKLDF